MVAVVVVTSAAVELQRLFRTMLVIRVSLFMLREMGLT
jgi:hypothetical protein